MFSNAECYAFQRDLNGNKICGERVIKSKGMIICKVLNVMEQQGGHKHQSRVDTGRRVGSEIGDLNKARAYRTLYGEEFGFLSEASQHFGWNIDVVWSYKDLSRQYEGDRVPGNQSRSRETNQGTLSVIQQEMIVAWIKVLTVEWLDGWILHTFKGTTNAVICFFLFDCFEDRSKREIGDTKVSPNICPEQVET